MTTTLIKWQPAAIETEEDVRAFIRDCIEQIGPGFHPDTPFEDYVEGGAPGMDGQPRFDPFDARRLDATMEECFEKADLNFDIYRIALDQMQIVERQRRQTKVKTRPAVGSRVKLRRNVERYPFFVALAGKFGTVTESNDEEVWVKMDEPLPNAEEWDNCILWMYDSLPSDLDEDLEVV